MATTRRCYGTVVDRHPGRSYNSTVSRGVLYTRRDPRYLFLSNSSPKTEDFARSVSLVANPDENPRKALGHIGDAELPIIPGVPWRENRYLSVLEQQTILRIDRQQATTKLARQAETRTTIAGAAMYQRILVAIDEHEPAEKALEQAILLAKDQHAHLRLVHVIEDRESRVLDATVLDVEKMEAKWRHAGQAILDVAAERARQAGLTPDVTLLPKDGETHTARVIVAEAGRWRADLIILGTHGRRGLSHLFHSSVAQAVARIATVPVLLVR